MVTTPRSGYRGLTIKHVVVNADWLMAATSAEPKTTGLFKGDEPTPEAELEPEPQERFGAGEVGSLGSFGSGGEGKYSYNGGTGGVAAAGQNTWNQDSASQAELDPDPMATFLAHARAHDQKPT